MYEYSANVLRVVDGDTIDVMVDLGMHIHVKERIRLLGVNTPETYGVSKDSEEYRAGKAAQAQVIHWLCPGITGRESIDLATNGNGGMVGEVVGTVRVRTHKDSKGKYGRYLAEIFVGDDTESINTKLIHMGFGAEY